MEESFRQFYSIKIYQLHFFDVSKTTLASFHRLISLLARLHWRTAAVCWDEPLLSIISFTRLLIYGQYCSHMENAQKTLDELIATREDIKVKVEVKVSAQKHQHLKVYVLLFWRRWLDWRWRLTVLRVTTVNSFCVARIVPQECTMKVQEGKFKLQDLLVVPMQRVLKYHLLLKARARTQPAVKFPFHSSVAECAVTGRRACYSLLHVASMPEKQQEHVAAQGNSLRNDVNNTAFIQAEDKVVCRVPATLGSFPVLIIALY